MKCVNCKQMSTKLTTEYQSKEAVMSSFSPEMLNDLKQFLKSIIDPISACVDKLCNKVDQNAADIQEIKHINEDQDQRIKKCESDHRECFDQIAQLKNDLDYVTNRLNVKDQMSLSNYIEISGIHDKLILDNHTIVDRIAEEIGFLKPIQATDSVSRHARGKLNFNIVTLKFVVYSDEQEFLKAAKDYSAEDRDLNNSIFNNQYADQRIYINDLLTPFN